MGPRVRIGWGVGGDTKRLGVAALPPLPRAWPGAQSTSRSNRKCVSPRRSRGLRLPIPLRPPFLDVSRFRVRVPPASAPPSAREGRECRKGFRPRTFSSCTNRVVKANVTRGRTCFAHPWRFSGFSSPCPSWLPHVVSPARLSRASPEALGACGPGTPRFRPGCPRLPVTDTALIWTVVPL